MLSVCSEYSPTQNLGIRNTCTHTYYTDTSWGVETYPQTYLAVGDLDMAGLAALHDINPSIQLHHGVEYHTRVLGTAQHGVSLTSTYTHTHTHKLLAWGQG